MDYRIASGAVYFEPLASGRVPIDWFDSGCTFFRRHGLVVEHFDINAPGIFSEGVHGFGTNRERLSEAIKGKQVLSIGLYSGLALGEGKCGWRAMVSIEMNGGLSFWGIDETCKSRVGDVLREAFAAANPIVPVGYGIGYKHAARDAPEAYAVGASFVRAENMHDIIEPSPKRDRLTAWLNDQQGARRHLRGMFRGAYPASILSRSHVNAMLGGASLAQRVCASPGSGLGTLTPLGEDSWLWELSEAEIPIAETELRAARLLIE